MSDIVERLRRHENWWRDIGIPEMAEAVDTITTLRAEVERLRAFVSVADELRDSIWIGTENKRKVIAILDYDIARAALAQEKQG